MSLRTQPYAILVVDDNPADVRLLQEAFGACGHRCQLTCTDSIPAATQILQTKTFDLVISDMGPYKEGLALLSVIRSDKRLKTIPVIVLSGVSDPLHAYEAGANAFISKDADIDTFFRKVKTLMEFWVNVAELPRSSHATTPA